MFWHEAEPDKWSDKDAKFDAFAMCILAAARGELNVWGKTQRARWHGSLRIIVLGCSQDQ